MNLVKFTEIGIPEQGSPVWINPNYIKAVGLHPDGTIIHLESEFILVVKESIAEVLCALEVQL
jgi:uncharacterized protein YlzI (FlbEa/FlbD family)